MICTEGGGQGSCQGDSGGAVVSLGPGRKYEVIGVVSWGIDCTRGRYHSVAARTTTVLRWIDDNTSDVYKSTASFKEAMDAVYGKANVGILKKYLDTNGADDETAGDWTMLISAAARPKNTEVIKILLDAGAAVNAQPGQFGYTALLIASQYRHTENVLLLLKHPSIDVNLTDGYGWTALMHAASNFDSESVKSILAKPGVDINHENNDGDTALAWAEKDWIKRLLVQRGAVCKCVSEGCSC